MAPQTRKNTNSSDHAERLGTSSGSSGARLAALIEKLVTMQVQIQGYLQQQNTEQATRLVQMMNAAVGRRHNNNDAQKDDEVDDNSNQNDEPNQNNGFPANQAARADEASIKRYNQCKSKEFKGTGGEAENWIRAAERIFKAINCTNAQKVPLAEFSMHGQAQVWWESERELTTTKGVLT